MKTSLNRIFIAAVFLTGLTTVLPSQAQSSRDVSLDDITLASNVKAALLRVTPFQEADVDITVTATDGQVKLSGWVTFANDPQVAAKIAASVNGVKTVSTSFHTWSSDSNYRL